MTNKSPLKLSIRDMKNLEKLKDLCTEIRDTIYELDFYKEDNNDYYIGSPVGCENEEILHYLMKLSICDGYNTVICPLIDEYTITEKGYYNE